MDYQKNVADFWNNGYLVLEDFFDPALMDRYQQLVLNHFSDNTCFLHNEEFLCKSSTEVIPWFPQREGVRAFDEVENNPVVAQLTEQILGSGWSSQYSMVMYSKAGTKGQAWHQDCPADNPKKFNLNRLVYTMNITAQTGGQVLVVPGSHRRGQLTVGQVDENFTDQVILEPKKGTLLLIHGHTWHRVLPVVGPYRVSANYRCAPKGTPDDITDICVYRNMRYRFSSSEVIEEREG